MNTWIICGGFAFPPKNQRKYVYTFLISNCQASESCSDIIVLFWTKNIFLYVNKEVETFWRSNKIYRYVNHAFQPFKIFSILVDVISQTYSICNTNSYMITASVTKELNFQAHSVKSEKNKGKSFKLIHCLIQVAFVLNIPIFGKQ